MAVSPLRRSIQATSFSPSLVYLGVAGQGAAKGQWCWEAQLSAASGQWLSPQVWAAVVASGRAGVCLKEGERKEGRRNVRTIGLLRETPGVRRPHYLRSHQRTGPC